MRKKDKENITVHVPISYLGHTWKGEFKELSPNQTYDLVIDYPFGGCREHHFPIKTGKSALGLISLLGKIGSLYQKIYDDPDGYGVFGHDIEDLSLCGIDVNHKTKTITLSISS